MFESKSNQCEVKRIAATSQDVIARLKLLRRQTEDTEQFVNEWKYVY